MGQYLWATWLGARVLNYFEPGWIGRVADATAAPDNAFIPRVADAGKIFGDQQVMHNGLRVLLGSYYGVYGAALLQRNRGVHEPQEERAFKEVLRHLRPNPVMLELGAYWAFYSMWFYRCAQNPTCYMVEPDAEHLMVGQRNFEINGMSGSFTHARVGNYDGTTPEGARMIRVDDFLVQHAIKFVDILHADIQGAELRMLEGAKGGIEAGRVGYLFISTHSNELHEQCLNFLRERNYLILADSDLDDSYSIDGVIVARSPDIAGPQSLSITLKRLSGIEGERRREQGAAPANDETEPIIHPA